jgi:hypothetical protein
MRVCTSELYLGALTNRQRLQIFSCTDLNAFDEDLVREWTEEVRDAALFYMAAAGREGQDKKHKQARL